MQTRPELKFGRKTTTSQPATLVSRRLRGIGLAAYFLLGSFLQAQDHTLLFSTGDVGVSKTITNWGLDTCWNDVNNMRRGLIFMGAANVNIVRVPFVVDAPLTNNDISPAQKATLQSAVTTAALAGPNARWDMNIASSVDPWYQSGANRVYPDRWAAAIQACQRYYNRSIFMVEGFNEPDFTSNNEGSAQDLYNIFGYLQASTNFPGTLMAGGSTLNNDLASTWYKPVASRAAVGTTHCLAGSASTYVSFIQTVVASNGVPYNPELHNVMEAMMGVEYGLKGGIWWGTAELTRGSFVKACQGKRLAYSDDLPKWTAASVYRGTNGAVQAFVGASERMATTTSYRFFSRYRDVFYDGNGPQREYTVTIVGGSGYQVGQLNLEKMVNINWGADVQPAIGGRYAIVNRYSGKALEVPGAKTNYGVVLDQITYTGASNQLWDVYPISTNFGGDMNYFTLSAAHSGATADNSNFSYNDGNSIIQWGTGGNVVEHWYFEYVGNGYFKIRNRWSGKCLDLSSQSTGNGITIAQWSDLGRLSQQWRLVPAGAAVEFVAPAPPASLIATPNAASTQLNWAANTETDLAGYTVLRAANSGGPYEIVARGLTNNSFTDKSANRLGTYFYVVKAADRSLNTSGNSTEVSVAPTCGPALIARYAFDGSTNDSSGNANHAIVTMGSPGFTSGKYGSAMNLNGTDQYTMLPAEMFASVTNFTIAAWVNWNGGSAWQRIFDFGNDTTQNMFLTPNSGNGTLRFAITTNAGGAEQILETLPLPVGQWRHVAITRNGNIARLYTNGVLAVSGTVTIAPAAFNPALNYLGYSQYASDPLFNGRLDELFVYNYALSDTEITRLAANQPPPPSTPTTMAASLANNVLLMSWPSNYLGCRLESNSVSLTATGSWFTVTGTASTNRMTIPINLSDSNVFFRLVYP